MYVNPSKYDFFPSLLDNLVFSFRSFSATYVLKSLIRSFMFVALTNISDFSWGVGKRLQQTAAAANFPIPSHVDFPLVPASTCMRIRTPWIVSVQTVGSSDDETTDVEGGGDAPPRLPYSLRRRSLPSHDGGSTTVVVAGTSLSPCRRRALVIAAAAITAQEDCWASRKKLRWRGGGRLGAASSQTCSPYSYRGRESLGLGPVAATNTSCSSFDGMAFLSASRLRGGGGGTSGSSAPDPFHPACWAFGREEAG